MPDALPLPLRVLVAHPLLEVRRLAEYLIGRADDLRLLGSVASPVDLVDAASALRPDAVLLDARLPCLDGDALGRLRQRRCEVVLVRDVGDVEASIEALRALRAG